MSALVCLIALPALSLADSCESDHRCTCDPECGENQHCAWEFPNSSGRSSSDWNTICECKSGLFNLSKISRLKGHMDILNLFQGFMLEDPQDVTSQCVSKSKCDSINCLVKHAKCEDLEEGEKGYNISGHKDMGVGYSCVEKCHKVGFDNVGDKKDLMTDESPSISHQNRSHVT